MVRRRKAGVAGLAHDLIQAQPRLLERIKKLRLRLVAFLGEIQETEHRSREDHKNPNRNHHLDECESCLFHVSRCGSHFSTMLSRFTGKRAKLPPSRRTPTIKRLAPFARVQDAHRTS